MDLDDYRLVGVSKLLFDYLRSKIPAAVAAVPERGADQSVLAAYLATDEVYADFLDGVGEEDLPVYEEAITKMKASMARASG